jgi:hypothetical protein
METIYFSPFTQPWAVRFNGLGGPVEIFKADVLSDGLHGNVGVCNIWPGEGFWHAPLQARRVIGLLGSPTHQFIDPPGPSWVLTDDQWAAICVEMRKGDRIP